MTIKKFILYSTLAFCFFLPSLVNAQVLNGPESDASDAITVDYSHYRHLARQGKSFAIVDNMGKLITPYKYAYISPYIYDGLLCARDNDGHYGFLDTNGVVHVPFIYEIACDFTEGLASVRLNGKNMYIDLKGRKMLDCNYELCGQFSEGRAAVYKQTTVGYINRRGKLVIPVKFSAGQSEFHHHRVQITIGDQYYLINRRGKIKKHVSHIPYIQPL